MHTVNTMVPEHHAPDGRGKHAEVEEHIVV
jgi:hypothetical protein